MDSYNILSVHGSGRKYWFGNFTVELRRRYGATLVYPWSIRNYILHRLGVTLMDFSGAYLKSYISHGWMFNTNTLKQWIHHLNPVVSRMAYWYILTHDPEYKELYEIDYQEYGT